MVEETLKLELLLTKESYNNNFPKVGLTYFEVQPHYWEKGVWARTSSCDKSEQCVLERHRAAAQTRWPSLVFGKSKHIKPLVPDFCSCHITLKSASMHPIRVVFGISWWQLNLYYQNTLNNQQQSNARTHTHISNQRFLVPQGVGWYRGGNGLGWDFLNWK